ncbi:hypothetical protein [Bradyrhizobium sp. LTSPM299]|uniref:hypothetical protein n=1 Tax=Bradyrhizobium sp. LTSPM299 TaxID=1619233 RepID=UPI0018CF7BF7|nr:hypothetical protein [Bradyrhizobium sp. LTSPM299]
MLFPLIVYATCGLALSLVAHILSMFGVELGMPVFVALHVGIFPLWIPVVLLSMRMTGGGTNRKDFWKVALSGCPAWMKYMTYGFFIYAAVNFAIFFVLVSLHPPPKQVGGAPPSVVLHGFSGHWMAFYSAGLAILVTAYRRGLSNLQRRCPFGHNVGWSDRFCPACGSSLPALPDSPRSLRS